MTNIFISYRRADSQYSVDRLHDHLLKYFEPSEIFMDIDSLKGGEKFKQRIERSIPTYRVLLAVIGPQWLDIKGQSGQRRLEEPDDFVRLEIEFALEHGLKIIPVLVEGAPMPQKDRLPGSLKTLSTFHALELSRSRFAYDVEQLIADIGGSHGMIKIRLGPTYRSLINIRMLNPQENFGILVDQKLVGMIQGPGFSLKPVQPKQKAWSPVVARIKEGVHTLQAHSKSDSVNQGVMSNTLSFKIKGGQELAFFVDREDSAYGPHKLVIQPDNPIYEV